MNRLTLVAVILVIILGFLYLTRPHKVVIDEKGKVTGIINKGRASLQGDKFWRSQLKIAVSEYDSSLVPRPPSSTELRDLYQKMREAQRELDSRMKSLLSPEELMANSLRIKADSIEKASKWNLLDSEDERAKVMETGKIRTIVLAIESKLRIEKSASAIK